ncbi:DegT/DnrJ/EryC1/StrS family aminotransferase [Adhaeribacter terreus]|uniref:DegT/DnrJ/EryC1/StrS family aminotransferase n=1 Tax=Adhaeribacter terreus TaxID=529703 RepID=A0ABW0E4U3_9BACT
MKIIPIFNTFIHPSAKDNVNAVLSSTFLSEGKLVKEFETRLSSDLGIVNPLALNSGTSALHLAIVLAGVKPGDEVICPAQTFVATALVVCQEKAIPVFADIKYEDGNIDPKSIEEKITERTKAIIAVHWGGNPCDMDEIHAIAGKHNLMVIEDAAHAPGATYKGKPIGAISDFTCFSFQAIKHITTGDGGAICCLDDKMAEEALKRRWFGINRANSPLSVLGERVYDITEVGYKYHLNDYAAALGLANLEGFKDRLMYRQKLVDRYRDGLAEVSGITLFKKSEDRESANWLFGFHVEKREDFILALKAQGITASVVHDGIDHNSLFGGTRKDLVNQLKFNETQIHIPIHDAMKGDDVDYILNVVKKGW